MCKPFRNLQYLRIRPILISGYCWSQAEDIVGIPSNAVAASAVTISFTDQSPDDVMAELSRIEHLYLTAKENPDLRDSWLKRECASDAELYGQVCALLQLSRATTGGILNHQIPVDTRMKRRLWNSSEMAVPQTGDVIDNYRICRQLGAGGMGTVFLAREDRPVQRHVALKLSHAAGIDSQVHRRLAVERQVLAALRHSGIPGIYNAGVDDNGRDFLVLEFVDGVPIAEFCRGANAGLELQLRLFADLCRIVSYVHSKGIVHRDVKSTNVLVSTTNGSPTASLIDFGIAHVKDGNADTICGDTQDGQLLGTPGCMSPEQFLPGAGNVDQRSDIYSMGLLLHKMLTNVSAFGAATQDPALKLQRLYHPSNISINYPFELSLPRSRQLDSIANRCLRVSPDERYQQVEELLDDVERVADSRRVVGGPWLTAGVRDRQGWHHKSGLLMAMLCLFALLLPGGVSRQPIDEPRAVAVPTETTQLVEVDSDTFERIQLMLLNEGLHNTMGETAIIVRSSESGLSNSGPVVTLVDRPVAKMTPQLADTSELTARVGAGGHSG